MRSHSHREVIALTKQKSYEIDAEKIHKSKRIISLGTLEENGPWCGRFTLFCRNPKIWDTSDQPGRIHRTEVEHSEILCKNSVC